MRYRTHIHSSNSKSSEIPLRTLLASMLARQLQRLRGEWVKMIKSLLCPTLLEKLGPLDDFPQSSQLSILTILFCKHTNLLYPGPLLLVDSSSPYGRLLQRENRPNKDRSQGRSPRRISNDTQSSTRVFERWNLRRVGFSVSNGTVTSSITWKKTM